MLGLGIGDKLEEDDDFLQFGSKDAKIDVGLSLLLLSSNGLRKGRFG